MTADKGLLEEPLLTPDEVCQLLAVSKRWLYDNTRSGAIPHVRVGRQLRFRRSDLEEWLR